MHYAKPSKAARHVACAMKVLNEALSAGTPSRPLTAAEGRVLALATLQLSDAVQALAKSQEAKTSQIPAVVDRLNMPDQVPIEFRNRLKSELGRSSDFS